MVSDAESRTPHARSRRSTAARARAPLLRRRRRSRAGRPGSARGHSTDSRSSPPTCSSSRGSTRTRSSERVTTARALESRGPGGRGSRSPAHRPDGPAIEFVGRPRGRRRDGRAVVDRVRPGRSTTSWRTRSRPRHPRAASGSVSDRRADDLVLTVTDDRSRIPGGVRPARVRALQPPRRGQGRGVGRQRTRPRPGGGDRPQCRRTARIDPEVTQGRGRRRGTRGRPRSRRCETSNTGGPDLPGSARRGPDTLERDDRHQSVTPNERMPT